MQIRSISPYRQIPLGIQQQRVIYPSNERIYSQSPQIRLPQGRIVNSSPVRMISPQIRVASKVQVQRSPLRQFDRFLDSQQQFFNHRPHPVHLIQSRSTSQIILNTSLEKQKSQLISSQQQVRQNYQQLQQEQQEQQEKPKQQQYQQQSQQHQNQPKQCQQQSQQYQHQSQQQQTRQIQQLQKQFFSSPQRAQFNIKQVYSIHKNNMESSQIQQKISSKDLKNVPAEYQQKTKKIDEILQNCMNRSEQAFQRMQKIRQKSPSYQFSKSRQSSSSSLFKLQQVLYPVEDPLKRSQVLNDMFQRSVEKSRSLIKIQENKQFQGNVNVSTFKTEEDQRYPDPKKILQNEQQSNVIQDVLIKGEVKKFEDFLNEQKPDNNQQNENETSIKNDEKNQDDTINTQVPKQNKKNKKKNLEIDSNQIIDNQNSTQEQ